MASGVGSGRPQSPVDCGPPTSLEETPRGGLLEGSFVITAGRVAHGGFHPGAGRRRFPGRGGAWTDPGPLRPTAAVGLCGGTGDGWIAYSYLGYQWFMQTFYTAQCVCCFKWLLRTSTWGKFNWILIRFILQVLIWSWTLNLFIDVIAGGVCMVFWGIKLKTLKHTSSDQELPLHHGEVIDASAISEWSGWSVDRIYSDPKRSTSLSTPTWWGCRMYCFSIAISFTCPKF